MEGRIWERYLGRRTDRKRNQKFIVHRWRAPDQPVTADKPFRGFPQLERRRSLLPSWSDLMPVILALLLAAGLFDIQWNSLAWVGDPANAIGTFLFAGLPAPAGIYAVLALLVFAFALRDALARAAGGMRGLGGRIDRRVYAFNLGDE